MGVQSALKLSEIGCNEIFQIGTLDQIDLYWLKFTDNKLILYDGPYWIRKFSHNGDLNVPVTQHRYGTNFYPNTDIHKFLNTDKFIEEKEGVRNAYVDQNGFLSAFSPYIRKCMRPFDITCEVPKGYTRKYGVNPVKIDNVMAAVASMEELEHFANYAMMSYATRTPWNDDHSFRIAPTGGMVHSATARGYGCRMAVTIKLDEDVEVHEEPLKRRFYHNGGYNTTCWKISDPSQIVVTNDWKSLFAW